MYNYQQNVSIFGSLTCALRTQVNIFLNLMIKFIDKIMKISLHIIQDLFQLCIIDNILVYMSRCSNPKLSLVHLKLNL